MHALTRSPNVTAAYLSFSALVVFLVLFAGGGVTLASPEYCEDVCNPGINCDRECYVQGQGYTTCGEAGYCGGGPCTPNWVVTGQTPVYAFQVLHYSPSNWCEHIVQYKYILNDTNNCGQPPPTMCHYSQNAVEQNHACCTWYICGGTPC